jgi:hypothetical protein
MQRPPVGTKESSSVFITRWAIPRDVALTLGTCNTILLQFCRLSLASLNTLAHPRAACVCGFCDIGFTNFACICSIRSGFWLIVTTVLLLLNASAHRVFGHPLLLLLILTSHTDVACLMLLILISTCQSNWQFITGLRQVITSYFRTSVLRKISEKRFLGHGNTGSSLFVFTMVGLFFCRQWLLYA